MGFPSGRVGIHGVQVLSRDAWFGRADIDERDCPTYGTGCPAIHSGTTRATGPKDVAFVPWRLAGAAQRALDDPHAIAKHARREPDPVEEARERIDVLVDELRRLVVRVDAVLVEAAKLTTAASTGNMQPVRHRTGLGLDFRSNRGRRSQRARQLRHVACIARTRWRLAARPGERGACAQSPLVAGPHGATPTRAPLGHDNRDLQPPSRKLIRPRAPAMTEARFSGLSTAIRDGRGLGW